MRDSKFLSIFSNKKAVIGMLHLKGLDADDVFTRFQKELHMYIENGVDAVIVENYYGDYNDLTRALDYVKSIEMPIPFGINCLNVDQMGIYLAKEYDAAFVQIDSVVGHVKPRDEATLERFYELAHDYYDGYIMGGVRFKYQPVLSQNSVEEDLLISTKRADAICVTENATGQETSMEKIIQFRNGLGDFPLVVAAGVTANNIEEQFVYADAVIIGSYFKDNYKDEGELCEEHIKEIMNIVNNIRKELK